MTTAILALEDGTVFYGESIGAEGHTVGEVVFNTAITGYQEILTDPSYARQMVTFTYPHIGNVGVNPDDEESRAVWVAGIIVRSLTKIPSNWRATQSLGDYLKQHGVVGIAEMDTRKLTRLLREKGAQRGCITTDIDNVQAAIDAANAFPGLANMDLAKEVTRKEIQVVPSAAESKFHVVAYDFGVKQNILNLLAQHGCRITIVPAQTPAKEALALKPDGIFLSNGPGDPAACHYAIEAIKTFLAEKIPLFGICLGYQLLALACGAQSIKMKFGHHGANHPVRDEHNGDVFISSQNHGFAIDDQQLPANIEITHRSLFDNSLQGLRCIDRPAFGVQGHPEASPGPHDLNGLFKQFTQLMEAHTHHA